MSTKYYVNVPFIDVGSNSSGYYELLAVLTHKGRSSSSGHYLAWVRSAQGTSLIYTFACVILACFGFQLI